MRNFRKAFLTILLFLAFAAAFSGVVMAVYFRGENYYYQDMRERDDLSGTLDFVVSGASHSLCAFVPDVLDEGLDVNSYNLSIASGSMQARYELLSMELERNPIDTVVIGLSYDSFTRPDEVRGYEGDFYLMAKMDLRERIPYFFKSIQPAEYDTLYSEFLDRGLECLKMCWNGSWTNVNAYASEKGHFQINEGRTDLDWIPEDYAAVYNTGSNWLDQNETEVEYFYKTLDLCEENGVQVVLVTVPISEAFICQHKYFDVFREWYAEIAEERDLTFIDFNLYREHYEMFSDEDDFNDELHLNSQGSEKFSELFVQVYNMIRDGEDVSGLFYDSYEELDANASYSH